MHQRHRGGPAEDRQARLDIALSAAHRLDGRLMADRQMRHDLIELILKWRELRKRRKDNFWQLAEGRWILLSQPWDWRWRFEGERTDWYPSDRLYRKDRRGDWTGVLHRIRRELEAVIGA